ncbi:MAG: hypothetical protein PUB93_07045 [Firmicutes bacterium]|nr:hypothetical protein [Bacillota bacterium]
MEGVYQVLLGGQSVGKMRVERQGLYYRFSCRCEFSGEVIYKLEVTCGGRTESLGIPVPEGGAFVLNTKLPAKRIGDGVPQFRAVPRHGVLTGRFVPLSPEEPFAYLSRLQNAFLEIRDGRPGIVLRDDVQTEV